MGKTRSQKDQKFAEMLGDTLKDAAKETGIYVLVTMLFILFCWICAYA